MQLSDEEAELIKEVRRKNLKEGILKEDIFVLDLSKLEELKEEADAMGFYTLTELADWLNEVSNCSLRIASKGDKFTLVDHQWLPVKPFTQQIKDLLSYSGTFFPAAEPLIEVITPKTKKAKQEKQ
jgi:hypothetical protein